MSQLKFQKAFKHKKPLFGFFERKNIVSLFSRIKKEKNLESEQKQMKN